MTDREKAIVMAYTGCTMLAGDKLGIFYQYVQEKLGRSVMTHELAYKKVQDAINEAVKEDFIAIAKDNNVPCNGWVSIEDRLPEKDGEYLCWFGKNTVAKGAAIATYLEEWKAFGSLQLCETYPNVTHWMPIEPPKEEEK